jgi:hypothetical protein
MINFSEGFAMAMGAIWGIVTLYSGRVAASPLTIGL